MTVYVARVTYAMEVAHSKILSSLTNFTMLYKSIVNESVWVNCCYLVFRNYFGLFRVPFAKGKTKPLLLKLVGYQAIKLYSISVVIMS